MVLRSTWHSPPATLLEKANDVELRSTHISEPEKLYAEYLLITRNALCILLTY